LPALLVAVPLPLELLPLAEVEVPLAVALLFPLVDPPEEELPALVVPLVVLLVLEPHAARKQMPETRIENRMWCSQGRMAPQD
jgi:hypothetical protein